jgi:hypothetical protein
MPDRYADAVRARRAELRALRDGLTGGHRDDLRSALALSRLAAAADISAAVAELAADAGAHLERADRLARRRFPGRLRHALDDTAARLHTRWAGALRPALRRVAGTRSLPVRPGWPNLPPPRPLPTMPSAVPPGAPPPGRLRSVVSGALHGAAWWRLLLVPLALLPAWGVPALGGPALAPLAAGLGVATVAAAARAGFVSAERVRLRRHAGEVLAAARLALDADLGRRLIEVEAAVAGGLDAAVRQRRAEVEAELAVLAPAGPGAGSELTARPAPGAVGQLSAPDSHRRERRGDRVPHAPAPGAPGGSLDPRTGPVRLPGVTR